MRLLYQRYREVKLVMDEQQQPNDQHQEEEEKGGEDEEREQEQLQQPDKEQQHQHPSHPHYGNTHTQHRPSRIQDNEQQNGDIRANVSILMIYLLVFLLFVSIARIPSDSILFYSIPFSAILFFCFVWL